jgi:hypothetical protein
MDDLGAEPLAGSGFEEEVAEEEISETDPVDLESPL